MPADYAETAERMAATPQIKTATEARKHRKYKTNSVFQCLSGKIHTAKLYGVRKPILPVASFPAA